MKINGKEARSALPKELPLFEGSRIEITEAGTDKELLIVGVQRILRFGDACMAFSRRHDNVTVEGKRLSCISYASGAVGIRGRVSLLSFSEKEEGK